MPINSKIIQYIILIYPFFYAIPFITFTIGYTFSVVYFLPLTLFFMLLNFGEKSIKLLKKERINLLLLGILLIIVLINFTTFRYTKPLLFIIFVINFYLLRLTLVFRENRKAIIFTSFLFLLFSVLFIGDASRYQNGSRYFAFLLSPTVYSVYVEAFLLILLFYIRKKYIKVLAFLVVGIIIYSTGTRLNFIFLLAIPLLIAFIKRFKSKKWLVYTLFIVGLNSLYPIYTFVVQSEFGQTYIIESRYEDGEDDSFQLRSYLSAFTYEDYFKNSSFMEKMFGRGAEEARELVIRTVGTDIYTHNDFIRFIYDFGLITMLIFLVFLYRVSVNNPIAFLLLLLYLFTFYHNMIYDFFIVALLLFYGGSEKKNNLKIGEAHST